MLTDDQRHPVDILADEFAERLRAGEKVSIETYAEKHPELADLIRAVFPPIELIEKARAQQDSQESRSRPQSNGKSITPVPQRLGDFQLLREIGRGGMGVVYEAEQQSLKRRVALKVLSDPIAAHGNRRERFRREAEAAAGLHHTNIVGVFGTGEQDGFLYYAMQLIRGVPLSNIIQRLRQSPLLGEQLAISTTEELPGFIQQIACSSAEPTGDDLASGRTGTEAFDVDPTAVMSAVQKRKLTTDSNVHSNAQLQLGSKYFRFIAKIVASAASGLQYAHHAGIHHRDIKPGNLMLDHEGTLWITDFGVAKQTSLDDMTQTGEIVGTLRYMAPEQLKGAGDHRSDIYSLGLTLIELLTLQPAINAPDGNWFEATARGCSKSLRKIRKEIPRDLEVIALKATAIDPQSRYRSAADLERDLRRFLDDRPILARRESTLARLRRSVRRNPAVSGLTFASLILLAVIAIMFAIGNHQKQIALSKIGEEFERAESNLREKTIALATADRERRRAETNLSMAIEGFEAVIENIGSRGGVEALLDDLNDEASIVSVADASLSDADIQLLESLLSFFDRFAVENETDLSQEAATANRRLGDIYQRLGRLDEADSSYRKSLEFYKSVRSKNSSPSTYLFEEIELIHEMMAVAAKRGRAGEVVASYETAKQLIESNQVFAESSEGRFALAKLSASMASLGSRFGRENRPKFEQIWNRRPGGGAAPRWVDTVIGQVSKAKLAREQAANSVALDLLSKLREESPSNVAYRTSLARAEREEIRLALAAGDRETAVKNFKESAELFDSLVNEFPESAAFKYELAQTLRAGLQVSGLELRQYQRSVRICDELIRIDADSADYRALRSSTYTRAAAIAYDAGKTSEAVEMLRVAIQDQRYLVDKYPTTPIYRIAATQRMANLADALASDGNTDEAIKVLDEAIQLVASARGKNRNIPLVQRLEARRKALAD